MQIICDGFLAKLSASKPHAANLLSQIWPTAIRASMGTRSQFSI
jgi:hypothetical protein